MRTVPNRFIHRRIAVLVAMVVALLGIAGTAAAAMSVSTEPSLGIHTGDDTTGPESAPTAGTGPTTIDDEPTAPSDDPEPTAPSDDPQSVPDVCPIVADETRLLPFKGLVEPARYASVRATTVYSYTVDLTGLKTVNLIDSNGKFVIKCSAPAGTKLEVTTNKQPDPAAYWFEFTPPINGANCDVKIDAYDDKGEYKGTHELNVPNSGVTIKDNKIKLENPKGTFLKLRVTCG